MRIFYVFLLFFFLPLILVAQVRRDVQHLTGTPLVANATTLVSSGDFVGPNWSQVADWREARASLVFEIDEASLAMRPTAAIGYNLDVEVELWESDADPSGVPTSTVLETLELDYDPDALKSTDWRVFRSYEDVLQMRFTVVALTVDDPGTFTSHFPLKLTGEIFADLVTNFDPTQTINPSHTLSAGGKQLDLSWTMPYGVSEYDVEWTFYDKESTIGARILGNDSWTMASYDSLFINNATRVTVTGDHHLINLLYPDGYVFYRVRAVHRNKAGLRRHGRWSSSASGTLSSYGDKTTIGWHEAGLNWRASTVFAEEGKHVPSVSYFDGILRPRQNVVLSNAIGRTIVSQSVYDRHGRPALQVLPAPTQSTTLGFESLFAAVAVGASTRAYDAQDFDDGCTASAPMSGEFGGQRYYSSMNDLITTGPNAYLPDAEGYPYSVTEWTGDATGRVRRQGGVGPTFQLDGGKETKYFYGKPDQAELDRLFGNEVGADTNYLKNVVLDPNGQLSVSYVDAHGRTIATALAGNNPGNVDALNEGYVAGTTTRTADILNNQRSGAALVSTERTVVTKAGDHTFNYALTPQTGADPCDSDNFCYECLYDLTIRVSATDCGSDTAPLFENTKTNVRTTDFLAGCSGAEGLTESFTLSLTVGSYVITKTLTLRQDAVAGYTEDYLTNTSCLPELETLIEEQFLLMDTTSCEQTCEECVTELGDESEFVAEYIAELDTAGQEVSMADAKVVYAARLASCLEPCYEATECDAIYATLLADVSPGGQYAHYAYDTLTGGIGTDDETSIFYQDAFQNLSGGVYLDEQGRPDTILTLSGVRVRPDDAAVTPELFLANWRSSWADALARRFHPEWCAYEAWCGDTTVQAADTFNEALQNQDTYQGALDSGYVNANGDILNDPFFAPGAPGYDCLSLRDSLLANITPGYSVLDFVNEQVYGPDDGDCNQGLGGGTEAQNDYAWTLYIRLYQSIRQQLIALKRGDLDACNVDIECIGTEEATCNGSANPWADKQRRIFNEGGIESDVDLDGLQEQLEMDRDTFIADCRAGCEINADVWLFQLGDCLPEALRDNVRDRLIAVCQMGCDVEHPYGASTTPNGALTSFGDASFADVLAGLSWDCNAGCTPYSITEPRPYEQPAYAGGRVVQTLNGSCACDELTALEADYTANATGDFPTFIEYLDQFGPPYLDSIALDAMQAICAAGTLSQLLPRSVSLPFYLDCDVCQDCAQIEAKRTAFLATGVCLESSDFFDDNLANYLNAELGFSRSAEDYRLFVEGCTEAADPTRAGLIICPLPEPGEEYYEDPCFAGLLDQATTNARSIRRRLSAALADTFRYELTEDCLSGLGEVFTATSLSQEYHYTLYYYDQAGNLTRTVPPKGVQPLSEAALTQVQAFRTGSSGSPTYPTHTFITEYEYNTFNEVTRKTMPDAAEVRYWYDDFGRPIVSQDGRQAEMTPRRYSYSRYDELGRIIETGENETNAIPDSNGDGKISPGELFTWFDVPSSPVRTSVTRTYYDEPPFDFDQLSTAFARNLRTRVAMTSWEATDDEDDETYDYATHYRYDATGNVSALVQDITELQSIGQGYKRIDYDYDYLSGNVHAVFYQKGQPDQYTYRYVYDENNRLTEVLSSAVATDYLDDLFWERDAAYEYYDHGPLARTELGQHRVQGCDYAYTLHGWIKGVNGSARAADRDMGGDGKTGEVNQLVGRDALAYTLGYYEDDYQQIDNTASKRMELTPTASMKANGPGLYNGNINLMQLDNQAFDARAHVYKYDQLHRLREMATYDDPDLGASYNWGGGVRISGYTMAATYDPNGNIKTLSRRATGAAYIDELSYTYENNRNRLGHVTDAATTEGVATQLAGNYGYDGSGNLVRDDQGGVTDIDWLPTGKVDEITMTNNRLTRFGYGPDQNRWMKYRRNAASEERKTFYVRDAQGNTLATYELESGALQWREQTLYGSSRLGVLRPEVDLTGLTAPVWAETQTISTGKSYELSNHLGNVLAVITDRKVGVDDNTDGTADYYTAALLSAQEYYPFGMEMPGRIFMASSTEGYRYGFNGKEQDDNGEWGDLTHYDYGARIYNPGIGRWLSVDPMAGKFAGHSPYNYVLGNPISMIDPDGAAPEWIDNGDGTYTAEAGDSALSLAKDAGISNGAANSLVTSQLGANYVGADGGLKSNVSIGDVIVGDVAMCESCHSSGPSSSPIAGPVLGASMEGGNAGFAGVPFALGVTSDAVGGVGAGASQAGGSMRLTNGAYNGNSFSPKYYGSGWKGGSVARIKTFNLGTAGKFAGRLGAASTFIFGAVDVGINMSQEGGYGQGAHTATLKTGGSLGGGGLGGWGGAALGSFGGPPGALIGGILGSIGGSLLGSEGGRIVAEKNPVDQPK